MAVRKLCRWSHAILLMTAACSWPCYAEIYKWVDARGQVHFSDKRYADDRAQRIDDAELAPANQGGNSFTFYPEADALLRQNNAEAQGKTTALSAGHWNQNGASYQTVSLLQFDISPLLAELHQNPQKSLQSATLQLIANNEDRLYSQNDGGHSSAGGDNAFYLKPVHNNFAEETVLWEQFFDRTHYTPASIRNLPGTAVPGSESNDMKNYQVDLLPLLQKLMAANLRQFTLEMRLQRLASRSYVTFYSREAAVEKRPVLQVELSDPNAVPQP